MTILPSNCDDERFSLRDIIIEGWRFWSEIVKSDKLHE